MFYKRLGRMMIALVLTLAFGAVAFAQGGALAFDTLTSGTYTGNPVIYTFTGNQDTIVTVYAIGGNGLQPTLALSNSSGQPLAFNIQDALTPMTNDVRVTAKLPANDTYIVTLNSQSGSTGEYTLLLSGSPTTTTTPLSAPTAVTIQPQGVAQQFSVAPSLDTQQLNIQGVIPTNPFTAQIQTADGQVIAAIAGLTDSVSLNLPANAVGYLVTIGAENPVIGTQVNLSLGTSTSTSTSTDTSTDTSSNTNTQPTDPNACTLTANNANLRGGPGTNYDIVGALVTNDQFVVTGQNNGWFYGIYNGRQSWVAASVVNQSGNCANLGFVDAPPAPVAPQPQVTEETTNTTPPTATTTTDNTNNPTPTTVSPTTVPPTTAPPTATVTPFVVNSFTCQYVFNDGATVRWDVTGAPNASFIVEVRQGSTTYSQNRTLNSSGFSIGNQRFGQVGNSNYRAYLIYNGQELASDDC